MNHTITVLIKHDALFVNEKTKVSVIFYMYSIKKSFLPTFNSSLPAPHIILFSALLFSLQRVGAENS